jgi:hypothetical protein
MAKITITQDPKKKADIVLNINSGIITSNKDLVIRTEGDFDKPGKAAEIILMKIEAGQRDGNKKKG